MYFFGNKVFIFCTHKKEEEKKVTIIYSHSDTMPLVERCGLSQRGPVLTKWSGLSKRRRAFHREAGPFTEIIALSQRGRAFHRENGPCTERLGPLRRGMASQREATPLTERLSFSHRGLCTLYSVLCTLNSTLGTSAQHLY